MRSSVSTEVLVSVPHADGGMFIVLLTIVAMCLLALHMKRARDGLFLNEYQASVTA